MYEAKPEQIRLSTRPEIASALAKVMEGNVKWKPGYDGVFGELVLEDTGSTSKKAVDKKQKSLDDF